MVRETGCDGVVVGRGCLGRPWLFADLVAAFDGRTDRVLPTLGEVAAVMLRHATLLVEWWGREREGVTDFRKHVAWYLKGFPVGGELAPAMAMASSLTELGRPARQARPRRALPPRTSVSRAAAPTPPPRSSCRTDWLADRDDDTVPEGAELDDSGG